MDFYNKLYTNNNESSLNKQTQMERERIESMNFQTTIYINHIESYLNKQTTTEDEKLECMSLLKEYFQSSNEFERDGLLEKMLSLDPNNSNVLVQNGIKMINSKNEIEEYYGYKLLEKAFDTEPCIPIDSYQGKWIATMIGRYSHLKHKYETSEKFFTLANISKSHQDDTNDVHLATLIKGYPKSVNDAASIIKVYNEKIDLLLHKNIDISFIPNSAYNFLILTPFNLEVYYEADFKECMYKNYLLTRKMFPNLHYISPRIKRDSPVKSLPYKLGIISAFLSGGNSVSEDFRGVIENLPRDMFDITFIYVNENSGYKNGENFLYPNEKHIIINPDMYENEDWLYDSRRKIEDLNLDLLFYLDSTMSSVTHRLMMSKLAPKQAVSHGHPVTSGVPSTIIDYYISWAEAEIETAHDHYTEKLVLLRKGHMHQYYKPRVDSNGISKLTGKPYKFINREYFAKYGLTSDGNWYVCMQMPFKLHPEFDEILQKITDNDEHAKIILHNHDHEEISNILKNRYRKFIDKVYFLPHLPHHELIGLSNVSNIVLDSYYAGGCTTTREALEIGSPVVTLPGKYLGGRWTLAYYNIIGVLDLVATSKDEYVDIALKYARNKEENDNMREKIRDNIYKIFYSDEAVKSWVEVFETIIHS